MNLPGRWFNGRQTRQKWAAELVWLRLRYRDAAGPTQGIRLLSRPQAGGRVALYFRPGPVSHLYLGVPEIYLRLLRRMAVDFSFSLTPLPPAEKLPDWGRLTAVAELPWNAPFVAHIVNERAFVGRIGEKGSAGSYWPRPKGKEVGGSAWQLPENPPVGLSNQPHWSDHRPPAALMASQSDSLSWPLGHTRSGIPLQAKGQLNIYGRQEAVADWLVYQVTQMLTVNPANLVVVDGIGDLVPQLKRKTAVTRLLGEQLTYVDIDGATLTNGLNPLAAVPGETGVETLRRWQRWFQGMNVHPDGIALLEQAWQSGVTDIPALQKWLKQVERQGRYAGMVTSSIKSITSLQAALGRLTASRILREWLEWPINRFAGLPEGALLYTSRGDDWARQQMLCAVMLAAMNIPGVQLVLHGFPWPLFDFKALPPDSSLVISNGPWLARALPVLVQTGPQETITLTARFLPDDPVQTESLQLLQKGEGVVVLGEEVVFTTWRPMPNGRGPEKQPKAG